MSVPIRGETLRKARKSLGLRQVDVARIYNQTNPPHKISGPVICILERGHIATPAPEVAARLLKVLRDLGGAA